MLSLSMFSLSMFSLPMLSLPEFPLSELPLSMFGFSVHMLPHLPLSYEATVLFVRYRPGRSLGVEFHLARPDLFPSPIYNFSRRRTSSHLHRARPHTSQGSRLTARSRGHIASRKPCRRFSPVVAEWYGRSAGLVGLWRVEPRYFRGAIHGLGWGTGCTTPMISAIERSSLVGCLWPPGVGVVGMVGMVRVVVLDRRRL